MDVMRLRGCAVLAASMALASCASDAPAVAPPASAPPTVQASPSGAPVIGVVASTDFYGDLAQRVGGDRVDVTSIITESGQDPHSFEASARTQLAISDAALIIENGGGYDDFMSRLRDAANSSVPVLDAVELADAGDAAAASDGGEINEHVWYDLAAMADLADAVAAALSDLDPDSRDLFQANARAFGDEVAQLQARQEAIRADHEGTGVAITEPVPAYLLQACGLQNRTPSEFSEAIEEGTDVPARVLAETLALITDKDVRALIYNEQTSGPQTERLRDAAVAAGIPVVSVTETLPEGIDYVQWMGRNLDAIEAALAQ